MWVLVGGADWVQAQVPGTRKPNPIAYYYGRASSIGTPVWTDRIAWDRRINMATFAQGATQLERFNIARDSLASLGGGVLYYPAGTYTFDVSSWPTGQGLMLKKGVVIMGQPATSDTNAVIDSATSGLRQLPTRFVFNTNSKRDANGVIREVNRPWAFIGLYSDSTTRVSDATDVGVALIQIDNGFIYFGPDMDWAPTWNESALTGGALIQAKRNPNLPQGDPIAWAARRPTGSHYADPYLGAAAGAQYRPTEGRRFVFACRLTDAAPVDEFSQYYLRVLGQNIDSTDRDFYYTFPYGARISVYGSDVLVSNNALPRSTESFAFNQRVLATGTNIVSMQPILYNNNRVAGIDINKMALAACVNRCDYSSGPMVQADVMVRGNFIYNHGHTGISAAGRGLIVRLNVNERDILQEGDAVTPTGQFWRMTPNGWIRSDTSTDNYSRAIDVAGVSIWVDSNWFSRTQSIPGADGEGIAVRSKGGAGAFGLAVTGNLQAAGGTPGLIGTAGVPVYGALITGNRALGPVGFINPAGHRIQDAVVVGNRDLAGQPVVGRGASGSNIGDLATTCPTAPPMAPAIQAITVAPNCERRSIDWADQSADEIGYRIERRITGATQWTTIGIAPRRQTGSNDVSLTIVDSSGVPTTCPGQTNLNLSPQRWVDFTADELLAYDYRVVALACTRADDAPSAVVAVPACASTLSARPAQGSALSPVRLLPNPATGSVRVEAPGGSSVSIRLIDALGRTRTTAVLTPGQSLSLRGVAPGAYRVLAGQGGKQWVMPLQVQ